MSDKTTTRNAMEGRVPPNLPVTMEERGRGAVPPRLPAQSVVNRPLSQPPQVSPNDKK
jgi:hypothetical protein